MKRYFILSYIISASLLFTSCKKDFLDREPIGTQVNTNFYQTEADAEAAVNAAYDVLQWELNFDTFMPEWFFGDIVSDDAKKGGENEGDIAYLRDLENFQGKPSNSSMSALWRTLYIGIYRCNLVISNVPGITMDEAKKARIIGEAKFLRAYYYFYLVRMWGDVPLITLPLEPENFIQGRNPKADVYQFIENDLIEAAPALPLTYGSTDIGRATRGAANSLLLRVYIYQKKWTLAQPVGQQVIDSKVYRLDSNYANQFILEGENGVESIFEIQHGGFGEGWGYTNEGSLVTVLQGSRGSDYGWGFNCPTEDFVKEFETGDPRLEATVIFDGEVVNGVAVDNSVSPTKMHSQKYLLAKGQRANELGLGGNEWYSQLNYKVIRYADVLLMVAEAAYHIGDETTAKKYLNEVRERARHGNPSILPDVTASGEALLNAIYHERRVELGLEGLRFFDIVRQGRAGVIMRNAGYNFIDGVHELFPVPQTEIDITGGVISQNNGY